MGRTIIVVVTAVALAGCPEADEGGDACQPNPCEDAHRTVCVATADGHRCDCDPGYHQEGDACVADQTDPCAHNPCTDAIGHRTRCLGDGEGGYQCLCDPGYHEDDGRCCQEHASNQGGTCVCDDHYADVDQSGNCVPLCTAATLEGLEGYCPGGQVCVQGVCVDAECAEVVCPEHATCVVRGGVGQCECQQPYHMSQGLCCRPHASNRDGECRCDPGYAPDEDGYCQPESTNPCEPNPCANEQWHRNTCVLDEGPEGFRCVCNTGFIEVDGRCTLETRETCPETLICLGGFCVLPQRPQDQCVFDADCREKDPLAPTVCNAQAAGGICLGCVSNSDCPGVSQCTDYGACANLCGDDSDCPYGKCYLAVGYCGQKYCQSDQDCFNQSVCIDADGDGRGLCNRIPCIERDCSPTKPDGLCPEENQACLYGACVDSCEPNPCTREANKNTCQIEDNRPLCVCNPGYEPDQQGKCVQSAQDCPPGFTCDNGVCADRDADGFQCQKNTDCGGAMACSKNLPSGICTGCNQIDLCPGSLDCVSGYCLQFCLSDADCPASMTCRPSSYCGRKDCDTDLDCTEGYSCVTGSDNLNTCRRRACD